MKETIKDIEQSMLKYLNNEQLDKLHEVLEQKLTTEEDEALPSNNVLLERFIASKRIEGCSERTIKYYNLVLNKMISNIEKSVINLETDDIRKYMSDYQGINNCSKVNMNNIRRILSSFYTWLEEENYIIKNPMNRIHKIKVEKTVKETISDENLEILRDNAETIRDKAIIDMLTSTGIRVSEMSHLNISDVNFEKKEALVLGKGNKERIVYFDARTKVHLKDYLKTRKDNNPALFVSLDKPYNRLQVAGIEIRVRALGRAMNIKKVHPHKFRRTMATRAIDRGMPIEQVQNLLGHSQIDTTMQYAMVNQNNVKYSHSKFIG